MWVEITEINGNNFIGILTNEPVYIKGIKIDDTVKFSRSNIATIITKLKFDETKKALVSKRAMDKKEINWAYRDEPLNDMDSGWQLLHGDEDDDYNSNASNVMIVSLEYILSFEPCLEEVFASECTEFEWSENDVKFIEVKET